jgi:hypothetical protein
MGGYKAVLRIPFGMNEESFHINLSMYMHVHIKKIGERGGELV